jgi:hypothetical protein
MSTRQWLGAVLLFVLPVAVIGSQVTNPATREGGGEHHHHFMTCAKACSDCALQCDSCYHHCLHLLKEGKKEHERSMRLCVDCAEVCRLAATLSARESHLAVYACDGCAKSCDDCAALCETSKDDKHMADCARSCRDCAKACREMIKMVKK